jgi:hypothetical protein
MNKRTTRLLEQHFDTAFAALHLPAARQALCPPGPESFQPTNLSAPGNTTSRGFRQECSDPENALAGKTMPLSPCSSIECLRKAERTVFYNRLGGSNFDYRRGSNLRYYYQSDQVGFFLFDLFINPLFAPDGPKGGVVSQMQIDATAQLAIFNNRPAPAADRIVLFLPGP